MANPENIASRQPPYSREAEEGVIAAALIDPNALVDQRLDQLTPEMFYIHSNRIIWKHIIKLNNAFKTIDLASLTESLREGGELDDIGSIPYLLGVADSATTTAYAYQQAETVEQHAKRREIIATVGNVMSRAYKLDPVEDIVNDLETYLAHHVNIKDTGTDDESALARALAFADGQASYPTGFRVLDNAIGGLPIGDLSVLASRSSMGKSAIAHGLAKNIANTLHVSNQGYVHIISPDQPKTEIYMNEACRRAGLSTDVFRQTDSGGRPTATPQQKEAYKQALQSLRQDFIPRITLDDGSILFEQLETKLLRAVRAGAKLIILDTIQAVRSYKMNRKEKTDETSKLLKAVAREFDIAVLMLSQVKLEVDYRDDKRPRASDCSDSKDIQDDANLMLMLYRPEYYYGAYDPVTNNPIAGVAQVGIAKQKAGKAGPNVWLNMFFDAPFAQFSETPPSRKIPSTLDGKPYPR